MMFFLKRRRTPRSTRTVTHLPYTTTFRALLAHGRQACRANSRPAHARLHRHLPDQCGLHASKFTHAHAYLRGLRGDLRSLREELRRRRRYGRMRPYLPGVRRELPRNGGGLNVTSPEENPMRRSEEHTSELQSLMRNSYAVFCLTKKKKQ